MEKKDKKELKFLCKRVRNYEHTGKSHPQLCVNCLVESIMRFKYKEVAVIDCFACKQSVQFLLPGFSEHIRPVNMCIAGGLMGVFR